MIEKIGDILTSFDEDQRDKAFRESIISILDERKAKLIKSQDNNRLTFLYLLINKQKRQSQVQLSIQKDQQWKLSLKHQLNKHIKNSEQIRKKINEFNLRQKVLTSKLFFIQSQKIIQICLTVSQYLNSQYSLQIIKNIKLDLLKVEQDFVNFISIIDKGEKNTKNRNMIIFNSKIDQLKQIIINQIKLREKNSLPSAVQFKVENILNPEVKIKEKVQQIQVKFNELEATFLKSNKKNNKEQQDKNHILQVIKINKKQQPDKQKFVSGSYGIIRKWKIQAVVFHQSIFEESNALLQPEQQLQKKDEKIITGIFAEKTQKNFKDKNSRESFKTQAAVIKHLRNQIQETMPSYYVQKIKFQSEPIKNMFLDFHPFTLDQAALKQGQVFSVLEMIASGIRFLSKNYVIHRDLKPSNILLTTDLLPKIIDFGSAFIRAQTMFTNQISSILKTTRHYNLTYQSLSSINEDDTQKQQQQFQRHCNFDIYAYGCIIDKLVAKNNLGNIMKKHITWIIARTKDHNPYNRPNSRQIWVYMLLLNKFWKSQSNKQTSSSQKKI